jgi:hypothetical protein
MAGPKKVFLSYVADTRAFVDAFCEQLFDISGRLRRVDWLIDNVTPGKDINADIAERIAAADVMVSFICEKYCRRMGADELRMAVRQRNRSTGGPIIIVPITLGIDGRDWWRSFKADAPEEAALRNIADKPFFRPGTNNWMLPDVDGIHAIHDLRDWLCQADQLPPASTAA